MAFFENLIEVKKFVKERQCYLFLLPYWLPNNHNRLIEGPNPTGPTDQAILSIRRNVLVVEGASLLWLVHEPVLTG
jgi:hypothetical protein